MRRRLGRRAGRCGARPRLSAMAKAYSATTVLPADVCAETSTDCFRSCRRARRRVSARRRRRRPALAPGSPLQVPDNNEGPCAHAGGPTRQFADVAWKASSWKGYSLAGFSGARISSAARICSSVQPAGYTTWRRRKGLGHVTSR